MYQPDPEMMMPMQSSQPPMRGGAFWAKYIQNAYENAAAARQARPQTAEGQTPPLVPQLEHEMPNRPVGGGRVPVRQPVLMDSRVPGIQPIRPRFGALPYGGYTNA